MATLRDRILTAKQGRLLHQRHSFSTPRCRGVGTLVGRPADYLPPGTVGQWLPVPVQWRTVSKGGDPKTDHVGTTRTPGWHPEETEALNCQKMYSQTSVVCVNALRREGARRPWTACARLRRGGPIRYDVAGVVLSYLIRYGWTVAHVSILVAPLGPIIGIFILTYSLSFLPRLFLCSLSFRRCGVTVAVCCGSG